MAFKTFKIQCLCREQKQWGLWVSPQCLNLVTLNHQLPLIQNLPEHHCVAALNKAEWGTTESPPSSWHWFCSLVYSSSKTRTSLRDFTHTTEHYSPKCWSLTPLVIEHCVLAQTGILPRQLELPWPQTQPSSALAPLQKCLHPLPPHRDTGKRLHPSTCEI